MRSLRIPRYFSLTTPSLDILETMAKSMRDFGQTWVVRPLDNGMSEKLLRPWAAPAERSELIWWPSWKRGSSPGLALWGREAPKRPRPGAGAPIWVLACLETGCDDWGLYFICWLTSYWIWLFWKVWATSFIIWTIEWSFLSIFCMSNKVIH